MLKKEMPAITSKQKERATCLISMTVKEKAIYTEFAKTRGMSLSSLARLAIEQFMHKKVIS